MCKCNRRTKLEALLNPTVKLLKEISLLGEIKEHMKRPDEGDFFWGVYDGEDSLQGFTYL